MSQTYVPATFMRELLICAADTAFRSTLSANSCSCEDGALVSVTWVRQSLTYVFGITHVASTAASLMCCSRPTLQASLLWFTSWLQEWN